VPACPGSGDRSGPAAAAETTAARLRAGVHGAGEVPVPSDVMGLLVYAVTHGYQSRRRLPGSFGAERRLRPTGRRVPSCAQSTPYLQFCTAAGLVRYRGRWGVPGGSPMLGNDHRLRRHNKTRVPRYTVALERITGVLVGLGRPGSLTSGVQGLQLPED
jgi:hypothetical protein